MVQEHLEVDHSYFFLSSVDILKFESESTLVLVGFKFAQYNKNFQSKDILQ